MCRVYIYMSVYVCIYLYSYSAVLCCAVLCCAVLCCAWLFFPTIQLYIIII